MERLINRRQQGDLGEASALEWLTSQGATVFLPFGHSPDVDLIAAVTDRLLRVQVKTSTCRCTTPDGHPRWSVLVATRGGNRSWTGTSKALDPGRFDVLFVLVGDGRRWLIPSTEIEARASVTLGGGKYSEFEIVAGRAIDDLVYGPVSRALESSSPNAGEYPSGQRMAPVKRLAQPSQVRILPPPYAPETPAYERKLGRSGQAIVWTKRRLTIPLQPFDEAGFQIGDRVRAWSDEQGRIILSRIETPGEHENGPPESGPSPPIADAQANRG